MRYKARNIARTRLAQGCQASDTTIFVEDGSVLPDAPFVLFIGSRSNFEIVVCTAKSGNSLTVQRGQEGTSPQNWPAGTLVENRFTAGTYDTLVCGPNSATARAVPIFADASGKILQDSNAIYVNNNGLVGIGTTEPGYKMHVAGDALVTGSMYLKSITRRASSVTTSSMTIWVDADNGSDTNGDGSESKPYKTLNRAFADVPECLAHPVTIKLKAAANKYERGSLAGRTCLTPDARLILEGTMNVLDSRTITSFSAAVSDPEFPVTASLVQDGTKNWPTNQFKYKVLRVFRVGVGEHYRIITYNSSNSLYLSYLIDTPQPDTTWSYAILDWGSVVDGLEIRNFQGPLEIKFLRFDTNQPFPLEISAAPGVTITVTALVKQFAGDAALRFRNANISMFASFIEGMDTTGAGISPAPGQASDLDLVGVIIRRCRTAVSYNGAGGRILIRDGSRILRDDGSSSIAGIDLRGPVFCEFRQSSGKPVINTPGAAINIHAGARIRNESQVHVTSSTLYYDGLSSTGSVYISTAGEFFISGNVGIKTSSTSGYALYVNGSFYATSKSSDVKTPEGRFAFYSMEATGHWFSDFGSGQLRKGEAKISIDPIFRQAISEEKPYMIFLTPTSDCRGLYVAEKGKDYFVVKELNGGTSNATFDYQIIGPRRGYEHIRLEKIPEAPAEEQPVLEPDIQPEDQNSITEVIYENRTE